MDTQDRKRQQTTWSYRGMGSNQTFETHWNLYKDRLWYFIRAKNLPFEDARDVFQNVALKLYRYLLRNKANGVLPVAFKIARDEIIGFLRKVQRVPESVSLDDLIAMNVEPTASSQEGREQIDRLQEIIKQGELSIEQRTAVILHYCAGFTVKEVATITKSLEQTVKSRLRLAKMKLRNVLSKEGSR